MIMRPATLAKDLFAHETDRLADLVDLDPVVLTELDSPEARSVVQHSEILLTGWGCPALGDEVLDHAPNLRAVLFAGGSTSTVLDPVEADRRGIARANAGDANAKAVAEYTLAMIILAGKRANHAEQLYRRRRGFIDREAELQDTGNYGTTVGLVGASRIGRRVATLLAATDLDVLVYDPYMSAAAIRDLGARKCELDELLTASRIVSIHAPATPETERMIGVRELQLLPDGATLINTARGSLVDHDALLPHLRSGRLEAVLDVTDPEPLHPDHELWELPNVVLTPHVAGATGNELRRMGTAIVDELERFVTERPFLHPEAASYAVQLPA